MHIFLSISTLWSNKGKQSKEIYTNSDHVTILLFVYLFPLKTKSFKSKEKISKNKQTRRFHRQFSLSFCHDFSRLKLFRGFDHPLQMPLKTHLSLTMLMWFSLWLLFSFCGCSASFSRSDSPIELQQFRWICRNLKNSDQQCAKIRVRDHKEVNRD